jgi:hypothetical protein
VQYVWRSLRKQKIDLAGRKSWCESNDPDFAAKAADVVGHLQRPFFFSRRSEEQHRTTYGTHQIAFRSAFIAFGP